MTMRRAMKRIGIGLFTICCIPAFAFDAHAAGEDKAITKLIQSVSHAMVELPKTKNLKTVLQHFAGDYTFVEDGEFKTLKDLEGTLQTFAAEKPIEELLEIKDDVVNVKVRVVGEWAWATYDETFTATSKGDIIDEDVSKCTGIFRRTKGRWLYVHEHCSEGQDDALDSSSAPPRR